METITQVDPPLSSTFAYFSQELKGVEPIKSGYLKNEESVVSFEGTIHNGNLKLLDHIQENSIVPTFVIEESHPITSIAAIDDNHICFASEGGSPKICNFKTGAHTGAFEGHQDGVTSLKISHNKLFTTSWDRSIRIWNLENGKCEWILEGHTSVVTCVDILNDEIFSSSRDRTIRSWTWSLRHQETPSCTGVLKGHNGAVNCVRTHPSKSLLFSASEDTTVRIWQTWDGTCTRVLKGHTRGVQSIDFTNNTLISASKDGTLRMWNITDGTCTGVLEGHRGPVQCVCIFGSLIVSGSFDTSVRVWDLDTGIFQIELKGHKWTVTCVECMEDRRGQRWLFSGSVDGTIRIWKLNELVELHQSSISSKAENTIQSKDHQEETFKYFSSKSTTPKKSSLKTTPTQSPLITTKVIATDQPFPQERPSLSWIEKLVSYLESKPKELEEEAKRICWQVVMKGQEAGDCPLCARVRLSHQQHHWTKILNSYCRYSPFQSWNIVPCCRTCLPTTSEHNLIDLLSQHPSKKKLLKSLLLKQFLCHAPPYFHPTSVVLCEFAKAVYQPKKSSYRDLLKLSPEELEQIENFLILVNNN